MYEYVQPEVAAPHTPQAFTHQFLEPLSVQDTTIDVMLHKQQWDQLSPTKQNMWDKFSCEAKCIITNWVLGDQVSPAVCFAPFPSGCKPTKLALCPLVCHPTHPLLWPPVLPLLWLIFTLCLLPSFLLRLLT